jgi:hypothetical protein
VYRDYKRDGIIAACDHTRKDLRRTLKTIRPQFEEEFPDFRDAVRAAINQHDRHKCTQPTPTPTSTPAPTTPAPAPSSPPPATPAPAPAVPAPIPAPSRTPNKPPKTSPTPQATVPPAPTPTPSPPPTAAQQEAQAVVSRPGQQSSLLVPAILLAFVVLGSAIAGASALLGERSPRFAAMGQAWREAAFRTGGTWGNFTDWLRLGR